MYMEIMVTTYSNIFVKCQGRRVIKATNSRMRRELAGTLPGMQLRIQFARVNFTPLLEFLNFVIFESDKGAALNTCIICRKHLTAITIRRDKMFSEFYYLLFVYVCPTIIVQRSTNIVSKSLFILAIFLCIEEATKVSARIAKPRKSEQR